MGMSTFSGAGRVSGGVLTVSEARTISGILWVSLSLERTFGIERSLTLEPSPE